MEKVKTEIEALELCKEYNCEIKFRGQSGSTREHVTVSLNAWTKIKGKDLIEAVNRLVDVYHTPPIKHEKLEWWNDYLTYYK